MKQSILSGLLVMLMMSNAFAEEDKQEISVGAVLLIEAMTVFNAALLGGDRGGYSATMALLGPMGGTGMHGTEFILFESFMAYNFLIDTAFKGTFSDESVFWQNMALMNAYLVYDIYYAEDEPSRNDEGVKVGLAPIKDGMQLSMHYQF